MRIVTAGERYLDIDAYAGCVAFAELLRAQGQDALAASTAPLNESITDELRTWQCQFATSYNPSSTDTFSIIDVSNPKHFHPMVALDRVDAVVDHHVGFEDFWNGRIGAHARIEFIGAACTLVYEAWKEAGLLDQMSKTSAGLLACGILDNTLNFKAKITTSRDHEAYDYLHTRADLANDWPKHYFLDCETAIVKDLPTAVHNDSKVLEFKTFSHQLANTQLIVWDNGPILDQMDILKATLTTLEPHWFVNLISLSDGLSRLVTDEPAVQHWLSHLLNVKFEGAVASANRPWLRKEIIKLDHETQEKPPAQGKTSHTMN